jgi:hypothetical protein
MVHSSVVDYVMLRAILILIALDFELISRIWPSILGLDLTPPASSAYKMGVGGFHFGLTKTETSAMLPDVAAFTGHAVRAVVHLSIESTNTVENPFIIFVVQIFQGPLSPLDLGLPVSFRQLALTSFPALAAFGELRELFLVLDSSSLSFPKSLTTGGHPKVSFGLPLQAGLLLAKFRYSSLLLLLLFFPELLLMLLLFDFVS